MKRFVLSLLPRMEGDGGGGSGGSGDGNKGGGEEMPQWAKELQAKVDSLTASGSGSGSQQIPGVKPPAEGNQEQPPKPAGESKKSKSFVDWLLG